MIETLNSLVPEHLLNISGAGPYTGRVGFTEPQAPVYFLALNPGGDPHDPRQATIGETLEHIWAPDAPLLWSSYVDQNWGDKVPGTHRTQRRVAHVFGHLGLDLRRIPASNLLFARSRREASLPFDPHELEELCWPFHQTVIDGLGIRTVITAHSSAGRAVRRRLGATRELAHWRESNERQWSFYAHETPNGLRVLTVTYPGIADWTAEATDPTEFIAEYGRLH